MYTDHFFYVSEYLGEVLNVKNFTRWITRACDEIDVLTHGRLQKAFPTNQYDESKVKKAVCAIAEALFLIEQQRIQASLQKDENGAVHGAITAISSGRESISYSSNNTSSSIYAAAAASQSSKQELITEIAYKYIANIPDANGINLLYAGDEDV